MKINLSAIDFIPLRNTVEFAEAHHKKLLDDLDKLYEETKLKINQGMEQKINEIRNLKCSEPKCDNLGIKNNMYGMCEKHQAEMDNYMQEIM